MTTTLAPEATTGPDDDSQDRKTPLADRVRVRRRLRPLYVAAACQGASLWVPVEKLFLKGIGFDAARIGLMAAVYAGVVPFLEIPSGILADRWSRRGVLIAANVALAASAIVGGLSTNVATYMVAALLLGVFFALQSGTADSIIYDTLVEETGHSDGFERALGRLHMSQSIALVASALAGAALAAITSPRVTYFATVPFVLASLPALFSFTEPHLHRGDDPARIRDQVATTYRTVLERGRLRPIIATMVLSALLLQALLEFGPLWMVALAAPTILFGAHWAGLMSAIGAGGALAGRTSFTRRSTGRVIVALMVACSVILVTNHNPVVVILAQVGLALFLVVVSTFLTRLFHDEIPSNIRAGVASGVGTLTWMTFMPFALAFGWLTKRSGVHASGWMIVAATVLTSASLLHLAAGRQSRALAPDHSVAPLALLPPARALTDA
jgi:MFS family permease